MSGASKTAVILCSCAGIVSAKIDWERVKVLLQSHPARPVFATTELACGAESLEPLSAWLREEQPDRVVVGACSPRDHDETFRKLMESAGLNPYLLQMANLREHVAWVTPDGAMATAKAARLLVAALNRVHHHQPLQARTVPMRAEVAVIGAGPSGLQAALTLARAGRKVTLIEKEPFVGGLPVRLESLYPTQECGSCLLDPVIREVLHGAEGRPVTLLTQADVIRVTGGFGSWSLTVRQRPRYVNEEICIGCMECTDVCPARRPHPWNGSGSLAALAVPFAGALPNVPHLDEATCLRHGGAPCDLCLTACPMNGAIDLSALETDLVVEAGALIVATGAVESQAVPPPFAGLEDVYTSYQFERLVAANGPSGGILLKSDGAAPESLAIVDCTEPIHDGHVSRCAGTCGREVLKCAQLALEKVEGIIVTRLVRIPLSGGRMAAQMAWSDAGRIDAYGSLEELQVRERSGKRHITLPHEGREVPADIIVVCCPVVPGSGTTKIQHCLELDVDESGFLTQLHPLLSSFASTLRGVYLAGSCRGPGDLREAFSSGTAAAGAVLSELVEGRNLVVSPIIAAVSESNCAGCRTCIPLCPYQAISFNQLTKTAVIADLLCRGCGVCVAACPAGALVGQGFSREALHAELRGLLE